MGRPLGSKNAGGSSSKPVSGSASNSRPLNFVRKTFNSTGKVCSTEKSMNEKVLDCCTDEVIDRSQVNFPYDIRINGFSSLLNTVKKSTEKVRRLILEECDLIVECRVCRNLFRSLPNFIAHKQNFCNSKFHPAAGPDGISSNSNTAGAQTLEFHYEEKSSLSTAEIRDKVRKKDLEAKSPASKQSRLNQIIRKLSPKSGHGLGSPAKNSSNILERRDYCQKKLKSSPTSIFDTTLLADNKTHILLHAVGPNGSLNRVMFQQKVDANIPTYTGDHRNVLETDSAVLGPDGKIICASDSSVINAIVNQVVAQVHEQHDAHQKKQWELNCDECFTLFPTRKTLRMHMRTAHRKVSMNAQSSSPQTKEVKETAEATDETIKHEEEEPKSFPVPVPDDTPMKCKSGLITAFSPPKLNTLQDNRNTFGAKKPRGRPRKNLHVLNDKIVESALERKRRMSSSNSSDGGDVQSSIFVSKQMRQNGASGLSLETSCSVKKSGIGFECAKCSSKFITKSDMSTHLVHCAGVINLAYLHRPPPVSDANKTGILIRNDYVDSFKAAPRNSGAALHSDSEPRKFGEPRHWSNWSTQKPNGLNGPPKSLESTLSVRDCIEIAKLNFYGSSSQPSTKNHIRNINNNNDEILSGRGDTPSDVVDLESEGNEEGSATEGDTYSTSSTEDDSKVSTSEGDPECETDRDSNITDSGVSTSSTAMCSALSNAITSNCAQQQHYPLGTHVPR